MYQITSAFLKNRGLTGPTAVVDQLRGMANIQRMAARATAAGATFRPHFKTHQSAAVAGWFRAAGVERIAASSLDMAARFADLGWHDITVALLHDPGRTAEAVALAHRLTAQGGRCGLLADDPRVVADLSAAMTVPCDLWLKLDTGYGRTGLNWADPAAVSAVLAACTGRLHPRGLLTHAGQSYAARGAAAVQAIYDQTMERMLAVRAASGRPDLLLSFGDTPCCSLAADLSACDEIRPGNFVFFDLMQLEIGSCRAEDLAAAVACPVLGVYPQRNRIVIHGGAVHLSKEFLTGPDGRPRYGCLGTATANGLGAVLPEASVVSLSQEHGIVEFPGGVPDGLGPGSMVLVWPVHSCLSCDLLGARAGDLVVF